MRKIALILLSLLTILPLAVLGVSASSAYQTYTYSIDGEALYSPDAYSAVNSVNYEDMGLDTDFSSPSDIVTDKDGNVYIADTGNNRIVVLNRYYEYRFSISTFVNDKGNNDKLSGPKGVFVSKVGDGSIWVCDTNQNRLVQFDKDGNFLKILDAPQSQLFDDDAIYKPVAMGIDQYGRIYVVSSSTYQGIIVMDADGTFVGFIGAQKVTISAWEILWRRFQTDAQKKVSAANVSTEYNNLAISDDGFIYVTTSTIAESSVRSAINSHATKGEYMPVKLLNPAGEEIMRRTGFWPPAGEVDIRTTVNADTNETTTTVGGVSTIIDVAPGPEKTWTIIDAKRNKIYTYDYNGNLLFAFGDKGEMLGSISHIKGVTYQGDTMLVLDDGNNCIIVYDRTEYGDLLIQAITAENNLNFDFAIACWKKVLQRNSNFDAAYVGIGKALYRSGKYAESLSYFETAFDTENWSDSFKEVRKDWMASYFILMILGIVAVIVLITLFFRWVAKFNKKGATDGRARKTYWQELMYGFYVIFHPFDGFYDLKHEHRGSVRAALTFLGVTVLVFFYQGVGQGYVLNPTRTATTIWAQLISVLVPLFLFVTANWCLTTLFEGEGSFKDIFIASCYSLVPAGLLIIPATIASNWVTASEAGLLTFLSTLALIWIGLLLYFGTMVTHDYSIFKNLITILGTVLAMAFIVFVVLLFSMLLTKLVGLVSNIVTEIEYRV